LGISGSKIFAGTFGGGIFLSTNNGANWTAVDSGIPYIYEYTAVLCLGVSGSNIFAGTGDGVFLSTNNGTSWSIANTGLTGFATCFAVNASDIFEGNGDGGVFASTDNGRSWSRADTGLTTIRVICLAIYGSNIFAGSYDGGVWKRPLSEMVFVKQHINNLPAEFKLEQNYPNPFNPATTISFSLPARLFVTLNIFDLLGKEVAKIASEEMSAGTYKRQWNAANMASGIYFYRLQGGPFTETKKLLLLK
jgi:hypothetical protein